MPRVWGLLPRPCARLPAVARRVQGAPVEGASSAGTKGVEMLYRIYTEDKNRGTIAGIAGNYFPGFTLISATGYWNGKAELSLIVEIVGEQSDGLDVLAVAHQIKAVNEQEAVLITRHDSSSELV